MPDAIIPHIKKLKLKEAISVNTPPAMHVIEKMFFRSIFLSEYLDITIDDIEPAKAR